MTLSSVSSNNLKPTGAASRTRSRDIESIAATYLNPTDKKRNFFSLWPSKSPFYIASTTINPYSPLYMPPSLFAYKSEASRPQSSCSTFSSWNPIDVPSTSERLDDKTFPEDLTRLQASMLTFRLTKQGVQCGHCCIDTFTTMEAFKTHHQVEHTGKQVYQCRFCLSQETWSSIQELKHHIMCICKSPTFANSPIIPKPILESYVNTGHEEE